MFVIETIIVFIIILALLVLIHEWGHFKMARKFGIRVDEFGFGFPPKAWGKKVGETEYTINWLPLGGFVRIYGEQREGEGDPRSFVSKPVWQRMIVIVAGVFMNWVLAFLLLTIGFLYGMPQEVTPANESMARDVHISIVQVAANSPALDAGVKLGDTINSVSFQDESVNVSKIEDVQDFVSLHKGDEITLHIQRGQTTADVNVTPRVEAPEGEGAMGVALGKVGIVRSHWYQAPWDGLKETYFLTASFSAGFYHVVKSLITTGSTGIDIAGPIGIGQMTYQFTLLGIPYLLHFAAVLSVNLAIINILPIPALDGGRFFFLIIEAIKRSPLTERTERLLQTAGVFLLIFIMISVTIHDVIKLF